MKQTTADRVIDWRWVAGTSRLGVEYVNATPVYWLDAFSTEGEHVISPWRAASWFAKFGASGAWRIPAELRVKVSTILDPIGR